jgi:hypothetical protein
LNHRDFFPLVIKCERCAPASSGRETKEIRKLSERHFNCRGGFFWRCQRSERDTVTDSIVERRLRGVISFVVRIMVKFFSRSLALLLLLPAFSVNEDVKCWCVGEESAFASNHKSLYVAAAISSSASAEKLSFYAKKSRSLHFSLSLSLIMIHECT